MIVYKFPKSRKWVQESSDGRWRSVPFGGVCLDEINTMLSYADFETFKTMYSNQISPYMLSGYNTDFGKKAAALISANLKDENKMREMFNNGHDSYECVKDVVNCLAQTLPNIHLHRENKKDSLQVIYNGFSDVVLRFYRQIDEEQRQSYLDLNYDEYMKILYCCRWHGVVVCNDEYTDFKEEVAEKYVFSTPDNGEELFYMWFMFPLDFAEILFNQDINYIVKRCSNCGALYATSYPQSTFCECCKSNNIPEQLRKNNKCRQLHNSIVNLLNNSRTIKVIPRYEGLSAPSGSKPSYHFRQESNFYWDLCQGKTPKMEKLGFYEDITSESAYYEWLKTIQTEVKA